MLTFASEWIMDKEGAVESTVDTKSTFWRYHFSTAQCFAFLPFKFWPLSAISECEGLWLVEISKLPLCRNIKITDNNGDKSDISPQKMKQWRWWDELYSDGDMERESPCPVSSVHTDTGHKGSCQSCQPGNWSVRLIKDRVTGLILSNCYLTLTITR